MTVTSSQIQEITETLTRRQRDGGTLTVAYKVLNIPELLECILTFLPEQDLVVNAQRVNKTFLELIDGSLRLQRRLFFGAGPTVRPSDKPTAHPIPRPTTGHIQTNPSYPHTRTERHMEIYRRHGDQRPFRALPVRDTPIPAFAASTGYVKSMANVCHAAAAHRYAWCSLDLSESLSQAWTSPDGVL